ncbi:right-handed parallel beta-helix repeat-containing protein, partial [Nitrospira sp. BLG_1]|uniref:right-handed parallel beta-helix repeat-containing protein n=1 Tax=Nitrospira sp. BLG_1 TaxID=3395883 RepID=UPI0039BD4ABD
MIALLTVVLFIPWIPSSGQAAIYYVATTGNNGSDGSEATPWQTIQKALDTMVAGDTTFVFGGTYNTAGVRFKTSGTDSNPISLLNYPNQRPIIRCTSTSQQVLLQNATAYNLPIGWIVFSGFEITNCLDGIKYYNLHDTTISRNDIHDNLNQGIIGTGTRLLITQNVIHHNGSFAECATTPSSCNKDHGIYSYGTAYTITNNLIYDNLAVGIQLTGSSAYNPASHAGPEYVESHDWIIANNTIAYQSYGSAVNIWGSRCNNARIENNIIYENAQQLTGTGQGVRFTGVTCTGIQIRNNHAYATSPGRTVFLDTSATEGVQYTQSGNVVNVSPPAFITAGGTVPGSPDFRLTASAPANIALANEFPNNSTNVVGAFKTVADPSCSISANIITCTFSMSTAVPISNLSTTGVTIGCTGANCPGGGLTASSVSNSVGTDTIVNIHVSGFAGDACVATAQSVTLSYASATGSWSANDDIGPAPELDQKIFSFTNLPVSNQCTGSGPSGYPSGYYIYYKFDEGTGTNANDESANNLDGTLTSGATWGTGKSGSGVTIQDNTTQYVAVPYGSGVNPTTQSLTIAFGINVPSSAQSLTERHIGSPVGTNQRLYISRAGGTWRIGAQGSNDSIASDLAVDVGWNHLCLQVNASTDTITLYKNGVASVSPGAVKTVTSYTLAGNIEIGHIPELMGGDATFDDFLLYQSVQDCAAIYAAFQGEGAPLSGTFTQEAIQVQSPFTVGGVAQNIAAINASKTVVPNGSVAVVFQVHCENISDCSEAAFKLTYRRNGSATRIHVPNTETSDGIWMYGASTSSGLNTGQITTRLTGTCHVQTGTTQLTASQIPTVDLAQDDCVMLRYLVRVRNPGDYFDLALQTQDGEDLSGGYDVES